MTTPMDVNMNLNTKLNHLVHCGLVKLITCNPTVVANVTALAVACMNILIALR